APAPAPAPAPVMIVPTPVAPPVSAAEAASAQRELMRAAALRQQLLAPFEGLTHYVVSGCP
ncbi:MAG: hypothetical protein EON93_04760, partial [Burkholderiales bacterium]